MKYTKNLLILFFIIQSFHPVQSQPIGVNLASFREWSSEFAFKDAFKMCREWTQINRANAAVVDGLVIPLRDDGYPEFLPFESGGVQLAVRTFVFTGQVHPLPEGDYTLFSEGTGRIRIQQSGGSGWQFLDSPGSLVFPKETDGHFIIDILESEMGNPVNNVRLVMPGFLDSYEAEPFHPEFLSFLENFECIRFMDWMRTNNSTITGWEHRTPVDYYSQTVPFFEGNIPFSGVAYEHLTALCNLLGKDAWVNIPHEADDNFVEQFAIFLRDNLHDDLKIYLEYSNEVWNGAPDFRRQHDWTMEQGEAMGYPLPESNQRSLYTAKRSAEIFRIFETAFGAASGRLVKVLAAQAGNIGIAQTMVNAFLNNVENVNPDGVGVDALAIAPYFGNFIAAAADVDDALAQARTSMETMAFERIDNHLNLLANNEWDIPLIAYEGGQHLDSNNPTLAEIFCEANRHNGMGEMYCDYFNYWYAQGGGLFMHYNSISSCRASGSWGLKEYTGQPDGDAPKFMAVLGCVVSDVEDAQIPQAARFGVFPNPTDGTLTLKNPDDVAFDQYGVFDLWGQRVLSEKSIGATIDLSTLPPGFYLLVLKKSGQMIWREKIVKL